MKLHNHYYSRIGVMILFFGGPVFSFSSNKLSRLTAKQMQEIVNIRKMIISLQITPKVDPGFCAELHIDTFR